MPRSRRYIEPNQPYELILRVKENLPFRPGKLINSILEGCMARAQRDSKVKICHYLWMGNHVHIILVPNSTQSCINFYQELQKKITDSIKRLLNKRKLSIWEGEPVLARILDIPKMIERIVYIYSNPINANISAGINHYKGLNSFADYSTFAIDKFHKISKEVTWYRQPSIKAIKNLNPSEKEELHYLKLFEHEDNQMHKLEIEPNAWMECFGIKDEEIKQIKDINLKIISKIKEAELEYKTKQQGHRNSIKEHILPINSKHCQCPLFLNT